MKWLYKFFLLTLFLYLILVIYINRNYYTSNFDELHWKDKYEHSQWKLPFSVRTLGDEGLYLYEGYRIIKGADPTVLNAEVPPLGKYLIGLSILLFHNGNLYGLIVNLLIILVFYYLAKSFLKDKLLALTASVVLAFDPLFASQFTLIMLDGLQLLFLLFFFLLLIKFKKTNSNKFIVLLGITLGLFSEVKFPLLTPILFFLSSMYIWSKTKKINTIVLFALTTFVFYLLPYAWYFTLGHNLKDWLGVQKWIVTFYSQSKLAPNTGSVLVSLLFGKTQNLFSKAWENVPQWSIAWAAITILGFVGFGLPFVRLKKQAELMLLSSFTIILFVFCFFIPFWTRYLVLLLPLLYLLAFYMFKSFSFNTRVILVIVLLTGNAYSTFKILFPTPEPVVKQIIYTLKYGFFQDLYDELDDKIINNITRWDFHTIGLRAYLDAEIEAVDIEILNFDWQRFKSPQIVPLKITYKTRHLGAFSENKYIILIKENGRWRVLWNWNNLMSGLNDQVRLETTVDQARRGSIFTHDNKKISEDFESFLVWVTPSLLDKNREEEMLTFLEKLFSAKLRTAEIHQRYVGNSLSGQPIAIGVLPQKLDDNDLKMFDTFTGLTLTKHLGRTTGRSDIVDIGTIANTLYFECCSKLYTTTAYDGISGVEKEKNTILKGTNGGKLVIKGPDGKIIRTILNREKIDGKDIQL